jgi:uncharacterized protein YndB with AHSA1/START domain
VTRSHTATIEIAAPPERVFTALLTPADIRVWWSASHAIVVPRVGGVWVGAWGWDEAAPDYVTAGDIAVLERPSRLILDNMRYWATLSPLPFEAQFSVEFVVSPAASGARLAVTQRGFPADRAADDYLAACERGWQDTLFSMKRFLEGSRAAAG